MTLPIQLTGSATGIIMKEAVRRAVNVIRNERFQYESKAKAGYDGDINDVFTSADTAAQAVYEEVFAECFPGVGLIGEEGLEKPCTIPHLDAYFTIDPLDGTKAFVREQSQGISSMVALVVNGEVISAWIGDVNTEELYGYRPGSPKVHRIDQYSRSRYLHEIDRKKELSEMYVLTRELPDTFRAMLFSGNYQGFKREEATALRTLGETKKVLIEGGSIGTWMARLWKNEVDMAIIDPGFETPWDGTPIFGISQKLGFVFLEDSAGVWQVCDPPLVRAPEERKYSLAIIHETNLDQLLKT